MKRLLLLLVLSIFCSAISAQTNTWTGSTDNNWGTAANWSLNSVPTAANDVIIPTGKTVNLNVAGTTKSITVQGNSTLNMSNNLSILNASSFDTNVTVDWSASSLIGGGTLTNNGTINITTGSSHYISGGTTLMNNGLVTLPGNGYFYLYDSSVFNNTASGVFDFQSNAYVSYSTDDNNFINAGLIKKTAGDGVSNFAAHLTNTGTISVENGSLTLNTQSKTFNGGVYNVSNGATLALGGQINISGTLTGVLNGAMDWTNIISVASTATFNFTGTTGLIWSSGSLIGGGVLTNESSINLNSGNSCYISGGSQITNNGTFKLSGNGYFYLYDTSVFNNTALGVFDFQSNAYLSYSTDGNNFINAGLIKKTAGGGVSVFYPHLTNTGTISVENGSLTMGTQSKTFNGGIYNVSNGASFLLSCPINMNGTLTGVLNGAMDWNNNVSVATAATFNFTGSTGVAWSSGSLIGGGVLTNESSINLNSGNSCYISGGSKMTNNGTVTLSGNGYFYLSDTSIFENTVSGVFDFQSNAYLSYSADANNFINAGLIKKTAGDSVSNFYAHLTNTGTISVENGTLTMTAQSKSFDGGVYNVSAGASLNLDAQVNVSDELTGLLTGPLNWNNNVSVASAATFNFTGTTGINWTSGSLLGGGILTNKGKISLTGGASRYISGDNTQLVNTGNIIIVDAGYLYLYNNAILDNQVSGVIDLQSNSDISYNGSGAFKILNSGLLQKTGGGGLSNIYPLVTNMGTISASSGTLGFPDLFGITNTVAGIIKGTATIDIPVAAKFTNDGSFAPGNSPGKLTVIGDFKSAPTSQLQIEINGSTPVTQYDQLVIQGNAIMDGDVPVSLFYAPSVGNEFVVATATSITTCNLPETVSALYDGYVYTFDVLCNPTNVTLKVATKVLGVPEEAISKFALYPNPTNGVFNIDLGKDFSDIHVDIYNMIGQLISSEKYASAKTIISEIKGSAGVYLVKVSTANQKPQTFRIIKK